MRDQRDRRDGRTGPRPEHRAHPAAQIRASRGVPAAVQVKRVETVPMSAEHHQAAVAALAVLIAEWATTRHHTPTPAPSPAEVAPIRLIPQPRNNSRPGRTDIPEQEAA